MESLTQTFPTKIKALEILTLMHGLKPVVRQGYYDNELGKIEKFCKENNLFLVKSEFKIKLSDTHKQFSDKGIKKSIGDKEGMRFVYISKDELLAYKAAYREIMQDHYNLGLILGYPDCCSKFFEEKFPERSKLDNNYEIPMLENSKGNTFPFYNNIFLRNRDICLLSHFPCSLNCEESAEIGKKNYKLLEENNSNMSSKFSNSLKKKILIGQQVLQFI